MLKEHLPAELTKDLRKYFTECLDRKRLQNSKDVIYDKNTGKITSIPSLIFNKKNNRFTLKVPEKKSLISGIRGLDIGASEGVSSGGSGGSGVSGGSGIGGSGSNDVSSNTTEQKTEHKTKKIRNIPLTIHE